MREVKRYRCEICGTEYASKTDAEKCEEIHIKPIAVEYVYKPNMAYPVKAKATFSKGCVKHVIVYI